MALANDAGLSWAGTDLSDTPINLRVVNPDEFLQSEPRVFYSDLADADGGVSFSATEGPLNMSFECKLAAADSTDRDTAIAALLSALSSHEGTKQLVLGWDSGFYYDANLTSALSPQVHITGAIFTLEFLIPNPVKVAI